MNNSEESGAVSKEFDITFKIIRQVIVSLMYTGTKSGPKIEP